MASQQILEARKAKALREQADATLSMKEQLDRIESKLDLVLGSKKKTVVATKDETKPEAPTGEGE
ncbi:MAG TPA: hypothetical protein PLL58_06250 [Candidatus Syntrophosphaera sp.]|nr:hypothetical protein [Candidatus Syntrophosphaera sp.]